MMARMCKGLYTTKFYSQLLVINYKLAKSFKKKKSNRSTELLEK